MRRVVTRRRRPGSLRHGCGVTPQRISEITVASFGVALMVGHPGRDPSFDLGLQPTHRVRGELAPHRKLSPALQTPECCPRQSGARADFSASEEAGG